MKYIVAEKNNKKYIQFIPTEVQLSLERDVLDVVSICMENDLWIVIMPSKMLSEDFFNLRTGLAGTMLQKFINYHVKAAVILDNDVKLNDRFKEMILEANKGNDFRTFKDISEAELWISNL